MADPYPYPADTPGLIDELIETLRPYREACEHNRGDLDLVRRRFLDEWSGESADACQETVDRLITWFTTAFDEADAQIRALVAYELEIEHARRAIDAIRGDAALEQRCVQEVADAQADVRRLEAIPGPGGAHLVTLEEYVARTRLTNAQARLVDVRHQIGNPWSRYCIVMNEVDVAAGVCSRALISHTPADVRLDQADAIGAPLDTLGYARTHRPPFTNDPAANAALWEAWDPALHAAYLTLYPDLLGKTNGLPCAIRDQANRVVLDRQYAYWSRQVDLLTTQYETADNGGWGTMPWTDTDRRRLGPQLGHAQTILADLNAIKETLRTRSSLRLMVLDASGGVARAAVATGDIDRAANIAVLAYGFTTTVSNNLAPAVDEAANLRRLIDKLSGYHAEPPSSEVVVWMGYEAPQVTGVFDIDASVATTRRAEEGGLAYAAFLDGVQASHHGDPNLTIGGHSYGSTMSHYATSYTNVVDSEVLYGSPGLGLRESQLPDHNQYVMAAVDDPVVNGTHKSSEAGIRGLGTPPTLAPEFQQLSTDDAIGFDGRHLRTSSGHSDYLTPDTTAQYNLAAIASGHPEQAIR